MRTVAIVAMMLLGLCACDRRKPESAKNTAVTAAGQTPAAASTSRIAKVVFVDQENACQCTAKRIAATWGALETALGSAAGIKVERIHFDTQELLADPYEKMKPMLVPPALYFLDERGGLVEMLQGELTSEQIAKVIGSAPKQP